MIKRRYLNECILRKQNREKVVNLPSGLYKRVYKGEKLRLHIRYLKYVREEFSRVAEVCLGLARVDGPDVIKEGAVIGLPEAGREERLDGLGDVGQARTGHRLDRHLGLADEALQLLHL